jgi:ureidoacrylate peracid hydrolase
LQNDFLHRDGAYGRAGRPAPQSPRCRTGSRRWSAARERDLLTVATLFTLVPGRDGEPIISPHLKSCGRS